MWWSAAVTASAREHGWPDGDVWHVDGGPRFGLFGPARVVVEVRDGVTGAVRGSFLFDAGRQALVASRVGPRRFWPVWRLRRWAQWLAWLPVMLIAWGLLRFLAMTIRLSEEVFCWGFRRARLSRRERARALAELPPDVRERVARRCAKGRGGDRDAERLRDGIL